MTAAKLTTVKYINVCIDFVAVLIQKKKIRTIHSQTNLNNKRKKFFFFL